MKLYQKIENAKTERMWAFRQMKPFEDPERPKAHWDYLLDEMRWMRTDFRQEKKWKIAMAFHLARSVMAWHEAQDKSVLCVKCRKPNEAQDDVMQDVDEMDVDQDTPKAALTEDTSKRPVQPVIIDLSHHLDFFTIDMGPINDAPVYEPFNEDYEMYVRPIGKVIPVSKFMSQNVHVKMSDVNPEEREEPLETAKPHLKAKFVPSTFIVLSL